MICNIIVFIKLENFMKTGAVESNRDWPNICWTREIESDKLKKG